MNKGNDTGSYIRKLITAAMLAAMCCVATLAIRIPSPMNGYLNLGDCVVLLSGWLLGPVYGSAAAAIGSALADIVSGYAYYAPGTFVIKGITALIGCVLYGFICRKGFKVPVGLIVSGVFAELFMTAGYFIYASLLLGKGIAAAASIPGNLLQGAFGIVCGCLLNEALRKSGIITKYLKI